MATKLEIYNLALSHINTTTLAAVDEAREARYVLDTWWTITVAEMLEAGFWKFAMRTVSITDNGSSAPSFGYVYNFDKPADWVRTFQISLSESMNPPLDDWIEENLFIFANSTPIYLRYVSNDVEYGMSMSLWTARFNIALSYKLAAYICGPVTGSSDAFRERLEKKANEAVSVALSFEALREPNRRPPDGKWNQSRFGRRGGQSNGWRYA
jgi:hypothetical protein